MIASVRPGDEGFVTDLGAGETVDYTADLIATIRERYPDGIDAVIDAVNRDQGAFAALASLVRDGGRATSVVGGAGESTEIGAVSVSNTGGHPPFLPALADLVVQGMVRVAIRRTYVLEDAVQVLQDFTTQQTPGQAGHLNGQALPTAPGDRGLDGRDRHSTSWWTISTWRQTASRHSEVGEPLQTTSRSTAIDGASCTIRKATSSA